MPDRHTPKRRRRLPILGAAFDPDQTNDSGRIQSYLDELEWYRPRGRGPLLSEGRELLRQSESDDGAEWWTEWANEVDSFLTEWGRRVARNDFLSYGPFPDGGAVGFSVDVDSARESADIVVSDLSDVPRGFSGLVVHVNDHGNVSAYTYSRGRLRREVFAVV